MKKLFFSNSRVLMLLVILLFCLPLQAGTGLRVLTEQRPASEFSLPGIDGQTHQLSDYRGKYLLVNFWALWCSPCRKEMPSLQRIYEQMKNDRFAMLAIHVGPSIDGAKRYVDAESISFPVVVDEKMGMSQWRVRGLPTTYLLGPDGRILAEAVGERVWDDPVMQQALKDLMVD